ncbi:hypothetical protein MHBO_004134, partial [Bonamia ostreae]
EDKDQESPPAATTEEDKGQESPPAPTTEEAAKKSPPAPTAGKAAKKSRRKKKSKNRRKTTTKSFPDIEAEEAAKKSPPAETTEEDKGQEFPPAATKAAGFSSPMDFYQALMEDLLHETIARPKLERYTVVFNDRTVDLIGAPLSSFLNVKFATEMELEIFLVNLLKSIYARNEACGKSYKEIKLSNAFVTIHPFYGLIFNFETSEASGKLSMDTIFEKFLTFLKELKSEWTVYNWKIVHVLEKAVSKKDKKKKDLDAFLLQFRCPGIKDIYKPIAFPLMIARNILFKALGYTVFLY